MLDSNSPSKTFLGVRFVLFGFDSIHERQVRAKLLNGGGVDAGQYSQSCSHLIVDKIVYDDPLCVAARNDGKTLVTALWVDHSCDIGMAVDATSIMYRPPRDLNGIPGAKHLIMCLTGYQRQDRDDIMTMVSLMGAQFSKPLVANKVTHLICYKFEGEKYELASKLKKIKLVNHRWLEDCLRDWELLPEDNYNKSGYEMEMMEAEAKDSEEDVEDITVKQSSHQITYKSPHLKISTPKPCQLPKSTGELPKMPQILSEPEGLPSAVNKDMLLTPGRKHRIDTAVGIDNTCVSEVLACQVSGASNDAISVGLPDLQDRTPKSTKGCSDLESIPRSANKSNSDARFIAVSYVRKTPRKSPQKSSSSILSGELDTKGSPKVQFSESILSGELGNVKGSPKLQFGESINMPSSKFEFAEEASVAGSPLISCNQGLEPASLVDGLSKFSKHSPLGSGKHDNSMDDIVTVNAAQELNVDASSGKSSKFKKKPFTEGLLFPESTAPEPEQNEGVKEKTPQTSFIGLGKSSLFDKSDDRDFGVEKSDLVVSDAVLPQHQQQDKQVPSSFEGKSETEKCQTSDNLEELHEGNRNLVTKQGRKKTIARKTLGSRPKLNSTANQKGSIYSNIVSLQNDLTIVLPGERTDHEKLYSANEPETSPDTFNVSAINEADKKNCTRTGDSFEIETNFMDDETEASEDKAVDLSHKADNEMELKQEGALHTTNDAASGMEESGKEEKIAADQLQQKDESTCKVNGLKGKVSKGKRQPSGKARTKTKTVPPVPEQAKATEDLQGKDICKGNVEEKAIERKKTKPCTTSKTKSRNVDGKKSKSSMEVEKENKPIEGGGQDINQPREPLGKTMVKSDKVSLKVKQKSWKNNPNCTPVREVSKQVKTEPVWFILSGHKLQRKEFQQVIRRLKGKVCRDSHQWSYQATHFITPDPIRRTEKFFAAAASGRWILKTDYLTACSQSGKFLDEEPYEWHKNGLSEDGAINLEAPRKWRRLREKTGHGAFYGMRIIIYGECIAPPLDTLKRVVKAGDGTILATSPPYTRFLKSGVDYAVVSPGMPRVDLWVQEFLQHEIPCIVADYLVEYVCKPGYSLERHVLYNTHAWAEKSFENLLSRAEEIVEDFTPPSDTCNSDDTACQACGSRDRGDVMLICGDESGSIGCGIGMHMDCFDPPLENIPEEDWFCPNCSGGSNSNSSAKRRRKGTSSLNTKYF